MNKQRRKNRGQPANGTVPGPGPGPTSPWALSFLDVRGSTPASASGRGSRTWGGGSRPPRAPCPGPGAREENRRHARASWPLTLPGRATPSTEVCSAGSRESGATRREARGAGGRGARAEEGPAAGTEAGLRGLPSRDLRCGLHQAPSSSLGQSLRSASPGSCLVLFF